MRPLAPATLSLLALLLARCGPGTLAPAVRVVAARSARMVPPSPRCLDARGAGPRLSLPQMQQALEAFAQEGTWVDDARLGRVWWPNPDRLGEFQPYVTHGAWQRSDAGWSWQSDLPWGRVTFHYGRWLRRDGVWVWAPGEQYAPAWVDWVEVGDRQGFCWAPIPPPSEPRSAYFYCCMGGDLAQCRNAPHPQLGPGGVQHAVQRWLAPAFAEDGELLPRGPEYAPATPIGPEEIGALVAGGSATPEAPWSAASGLSTTAGPPAPCAAGLDPVLAGLGAEALPVPLAPLVDAHGRWPLPPASPLGPSSPYRGRSVRSYGGGFSAPAGGSFPPGAGLFAPGLGLPMH